MKVPFDFVPKISQALFFLSVVDLRMRLHLNQLSATKTTEENQLLTTDSKETSYEASYQVSTDQKYKAEVFAKSRIQVNRGNFLKKTHIQHFLFLLGLYITLPFLIYEHVMMTVAILFVPAVSRVQSCLLLLHSRKGSYFCAIVFSSYLQQ